MLVCVPLGTLALALTTPPTVDLRSDTVTKPTPAMRKAMASADVGDDVFGDDMTVKLLESRLATEFGKEAGLFVPSGTQGNLISLMAHTWERGSEYIVGDEAHIYIFEQGGAAQFGGAHPRALPTRDDGTIGDAAAIRAAMRPSDQHFTVTKCVTLENTHNLRGGKVLPMEYVSTIAKVAQEHGAALHLDGARIWHAAAHLGLSLDTVGGPADSLSVCLSKGLGAPAGSVVLGSAEMIAKARRLRKGLGGTMRQTGVLAAAGLNALDDILPRLADDHINTQALASGLGELGFEVEAPQTNLLYFSLTPGESHAFTAAQLVAKLATAGVRFLVVPGSDPNRMRMVCHHQVTAEGVAYTLAMLRKACAEPDWVTAAVDDIGKAQTSYAGGEIR